MYLVPLCLRSPKQLLHAQWRSLEPTGRPWPWPHQNPFPLPWACPVRRMPGRAPHFQHSIEDHCSTEITISSVCHAPSISLWRPAHPLWGRLQVLVWRWACEAFNLFSGQWHASCVSRFESISFSNELCNERAKYLAFNPGVTIALLYSVSNLEAQYDQTLQTHQCAFRSAPMLILSQGWMHCRTIETFHV